MRRVAGVLAAPELLSNCVVIRPDGECSDVRVDHRNIGQHLLGGTPTFVGGIPPLLAFAVAKKNGEGDENPLTLPGVDGASLLE